MRKFSVLFFFIAVLVCLAKVSFADSIADSIESKEIKNLQASEIKNLETRNLQSSEVENLQKRYEKSPESPESIKSIKDTESHKNYENYESPKTSHEKKYEKSYDKNYEKNIESAKSYETYEKNSKNSKSLENSKNHNIDESLESLKSGDFSNIESNSINEDSIAEPKNESFKIAKNSDFNEKDFKNLQEDSINLSENSTHLQKKDSINLQEIDKNRFLSGDVYLLSNDAMYSVKNVSQPIFETSKFQLFVHIIKEPSLESARKYGKLSQNFVSSDTNFSKDMAQDSIKKSAESSNLDSKNLVKLSRKEQVKAYEDEFISHISGEYAVIFLFFDDSFVDIRTNADFIDTKMLLEDYAYPYLPAEKIGSPKYQDGVNEGLSNLYLATAHAISKHYKLNLKVPKPMEKPSEATKIIIYIMLGIMIVLFVLVSNGFFAKKGLKKC